ANTVDPVAGSYVVEAATNELERGAQALLERIERAGGTLAAIETGFIQREIQESAYQAQLAVESGAAVVVGVNKYAESATPEKGYGPFFEREKGAVPLFRVDPEIERRQIERLRAVRAGRSAEAWRAALDAISDAAR